jgi:hypothetical protein
MPEETTAGLGGVGQGENLSFGALRRQGIELAQQLAAESWTDYNVHDPGVTLLEQFCYALTDLDHRAEFDVADHLSAPDGRIDYERQGFELPERIFSCRPTTRTDYRRIILDRVKEIDNVRVEPVGDDSAQNPLKGLYKIMLRPQPGTAQEDLRGIRSEVEAVFNRFRNLCEDVQETAFVREIDCEVHADVEVERGRDPADILAEIYYRCAKHIAARVRIYPFEQARRSGASLEEIFTGPLCLNGFCDEGDLERGKATFTVSEFFTLINRIDGVDYVRSLYFQVAGSIERDAIASARTDEELRLHVPVSSDEIGIRLSSHGRQLKVSFEAFRSGLDTWALTGFGTEPTVQDVRKLYTEPSGEYRDLGRYTSIQTQLPAVYGVGAHGVPQSAPSDVCARARQLKGYLVLFDQLMANYTASIDGLRELYSRDISRRSTYATQLLDEGEISGLKEIYPQRPAKDIAAAVAGYDNVDDRKGRLLDYLLALYGEGFRQSSLQAFNFYATFRERERALVENKARFHRSIVELTRDRGAACDYRDPVQAPVSGMQHRVSYLLGFADFHCRSLTTALRENGLRPAPDPVVADSDGGDAGVGGAGLPTLIDSADVRAPENLWEAEVSLDPDENAESISELMDKVGQLLPRRDDRIGAGVLSSGVFLASYRLGHLEGDSAWQAFLLSGDEGRWWRLGSFSDRSDAIEAVNRLRRLVLSLNVESEGMHLIEHILLRPRATTGREGAESAAPSDFFSLRLSVLFPAWTARFRDRRFQQLVKETVCLNCPAHLVPQVLLLEFEDMLELERLRDNWLEALSGEGDGFRKADEASAELVEFLVRRKGEDCWDLRPVSEGQQGAAD